MVRVVFIPPKLAAREYWAWVDEAKERYDERVAILSDGGSVTPEMDWIARFEARRVHNEVTSQNASHWDDGIKFWTPVKKNEPQS